MGLFGIGKLNAAVVGTGYMAGRMAAAMSASTRMRPYAVVSRDMDRALEFGRENGFRKAYDSMQTMLDDKKVDLVYIATPASEHAEAIRVCIERGKPVLCETPLALTSRDAEDILSLARSQNVLVAEAINTRFLPFWNQVVGVLSSGTIGMPVMLTATFSADIEHISRLQRPALGGGALGDLGYYLLNFAVMAFGDDIVKVQSLGVFADTGVDRQDSISLQYRDGRIAVLSCSMSGNGANMGIIQGTKGHLVIENIKNFESVTVYDSGHNRTGHYKRPRQRSGYEYEVDAFAEAIQQGWAECPAVPHSYTVSLHHMMDFIRRQVGVSYENIQQIPMNHYAQQQDVIDAQTQNVIDAQPQDVIDAQAQEVIDSQAQDVIVGPAHSGDDGQIPDVIDTQAQVHETVTVESEDPEASGTSAPETPAAPADDGTSPETE